MKDSNNTYYDDYCEERKLLAEYKEANRSFIMDTTDFRFYCLGRELKNLKRELILTIEKIFPVSIRSNK